MGTPNRGTCRCSADWRSVTVYRCSDIVGAHSVAVRAGGLRACGDSESELSENCTTSGTGGNLWASIIVPLWVLV